MDLLRPDPSSSRLGYETYTFMHKMGGERSHSDNTIPRDYQMKLTKEGTYLACGIACVSQDVVITISVASFKSKLDKVMEDNVFQWLLD